MQKKLVKKKVLDAWAILALLQGEEPAASCIRNILAKATGQKTKLFISLINLGEIYYSIGKRKGEEKARETLEEIRRLPITIVPVNEESVIRAATLKINYPLSYADAFAAGLAQSLNAILVTGDPELCRLDQVLSLEKLTRK